MLRNTAFPLRLSSGHVRQVRSIAQYAGADLAPLDARGAGSVAD